MSSCRRCDAYLAHCHGTAIRHRDGSLDCTDPSCTGDLSVHDFSGDCSEISSGCCTVEPFAARVLRAG